MFVLALNLIYILTNQSDIKMKSFLYINYAFLNLDSLIIFYPSHNASILSLIICTDFRVVYFDMIHPHFFLDRNNVFYIYFNILRIENLVKFV
jgi:hypothetical protein